MKLATRIIFIYTSALLFFISLQVVGQPYLNTLASAKEFKALQGKPLSDKYGQVVSIKVVYQIASKKLFYINGSRFTVHHQFCEEILGYDLGLYFFNSVTYSRSNEDKEFLLGNINIYKATGNIALEISAIDQMSTEDIETLYKKVCETSYFGNKLMFLLNSPRLIALAQEGKLPLSTIHPSEIFKNQRYQPLMKGVAIGILRYIRMDDLANTKIKPNEILLIDGSPNSLPAVAGVITTDFQTPLSHLTILGQNRKIPIMAFKDAIADTNLTKYIGGNIRLKVDSDTFTVSLTHKTAIKSKRNKSLKLNINYSVDSLIPARYIGLNSVAIVGNKAANFGVLYKLSKLGGFTIPESAFAIPFHFYRDHIRRCGADTLIATLLRQRATISLEEVEFQLKTIRKRIEATPIDPTLILKVEEMVARLGSNTKLRFRSSTNAEDMDGFSGAGLYTSKTGVIGDSSKPVDKAIKKVWASLWGYNAFQEREYFNMDQSMVAMGVLVHRSFPDEAVNGVAVTKNIYRPSSFGFVVNAQFGDESVVAPSVGVTSEQLICYPTSGPELFKDKMAIEVITTSSLSKKGEPVMTQEETMALANQLERLKQNFYKWKFTGKDYIHFGLDVEFKLVGPERKLYIKQVRIYNN